MLQTITIYVTNITCSCILLVGRKFPAHVMYSLKLVCYLPFFVFAVSDFEKLRKVKKNQNHA